jgi:hypothetical protein
MTSAFSRHARDLSIASIAMIVLALGGTVSAGVVAKHRGNGAFANVFGPDASGCKWIYLDVGRGGTTAAPQTWLYYDVYDGCTGLTESRGWGAIPNSDLKVSQKSTVLTTTPSANSEFYAEGAAGSINITWKADGSYTYTFSGHSRVEYADRLMQSHGSWTNNTAAVEGQLLSVTVANIPGSIGSGRDRFLEIEKGK